MAKSGKGKTGGAAPDIAGIAYRPPSPARMIRMAAEHAAGVAMESSPAMKKKRDAIAAAVEQTIKRQIGPMRKGRV